MQPLCSRLLVSALRLPMTAGNPRKSGSELKTDGMTSALVLLSAAFPISTILFFLSSRFKGTDLVSFNLYLASNAPFMLIALVFLISFLVTVMKNKTFWTKEHRERKQDPSASMQLAFLWIFGLAMVVQSCLKTIDTLHCVHITSNGFALGYIGRTVSSIAKAAYILLQTIFISLNFKKCFIKSSAWINFMFSNILFGNLVIWLGYISDRSANLYYFENTTLFNQTLNCNNSQSITYQAIHSMYTYMVPVTLEYILLATATVLKMLPTTNNTTSSSQNIQFIRTSESNNMKGVRTAGYFITIGVHVPIFVFALLIRFVFLHDVDVIMPYWEAMAAVQKLLTLIMLAVGFAFLEYRKSDAWRLSHDDYILLCCMVAKLIRLIVVTFSICVCKITRRYLLLSNNILYLFQLFYFTLYILMSRRPIRLGIIKSRVSIFIQTAFFVIMIARWGIAAFVFSVLGTDIITDEMVCVFGDRRQWTVIQFIVTPFSVFYDFCSAMHLYRSIHVHT